MMRLLLFLLLLGFFGQINAQSTAFVFKGGLSLGSQKWDNASRQLLFAWHGAISVESVDNDNDRASLFAQFGYHVRGSATRFRYFNFNSSPGGSFTENFRFNNLSLILGFKQKFPLGAGERSRYYYSIGLRGDYTLSTNIDELGKGQPCSVGVYPFIGGLQRWNGGISAAGGIEIKFGELTGGQIELSIHPDFTNQYHSSSGVVTIPGDCSYSGQPTPTTIPERKIRNITFELSVGLRLLRKVVYEE